MPRSRRRRRGQGAGHARPDTQARRSMSPVRVDDRNPRDRDDAYGRVLATLSDDNQVPVPASSTQPLDVSSSPQPGDNSASESESSNDNPDTFVGFSDNDGYESLGDDGHKDGLDSDPVDESGQSSVGDTGENGGSADGVDLASDSSTSGDEAVLVDNEAVKDIDMASNSSGSGEDAGDDADDSGDDADDSGDDADDSGDDADDSGDDADDSGDDADEPAALQVKDATDEVIYLESKAVAPEPGQSPSGSGHPSTVFDSPRSACDTPVASPGNNTTGSRRADEDRIRRNIIRTFRTIDRRTGRFQEAIWKFLDRRAKNLRRDIIKKLDELESGGRAVGPGGN